MKKFLISKCMNYIKSKTDYNDVKLKEIEYGLVGIYLTISKLIVIALIALLLGIMKETIIFLLLFNIVRATAFGLHASKSWMCLVSSTIFFIGIPLVSINISINIYLKLILAILSTIYIFKYAPADTHKRPIVNKKRRKVYKIISTIISIIYTILIIIIDNNFISNCLLFSLILESFMISPIIYKIFKLPYNNYIKFLETHPEFSN